jgi:hypothetical protein
MAHELVHWHSSDSPIRKNLPYAAYEGLAYRIQAELVPAWDAPLRAEFGRLLAAAREQGGLAEVISCGDLDALAWFDPPPGASEHGVCALGFTLVDLIGVDALISAAERGPLTLDDVLTMAGVGPDGSGLFEAVQPESP